MERVQSTINIEETVDPRGCVAELVVVPWNCPRCGKIYKCKLAMAKKHANWRRAQPQSTKQRNGYTSANAAESTYIAGGEILRSRRGSTISYEKKA